MRGMAGNQHPRAAAGVTARVASTPGALVAFAGDVSLPNLSLTGCDGGADGGILSFSGGTVQLTGAQVIANNAGTGERSDSSTASPASRCHRIL